MDKWKTNWQDNKKEIQSSSKCLRRQKKKEFFFSFVCPDFEYLSHEVGEEEHVAEEGRPSQQVTDTQVAVMAGHVDDGLHEGPQRHPLLGLRTRGNVTFAWPRATMLAAHVFVFLLFFLIKFPSILTLKSANASRRRIVFCSGPQMQREAAETPLVKHLFASCRKLHFDAGAFAPNASARTAEWIPRRAPHRVCGGTKRRQVCWRILRLKPLNSPLMNSVLINST